MSAEQQPTILNVTNSLADLEYLKERMEGIDDWAASGRIEDLQWRIKAVVEDLNQVEKFILWLDYLDGKPKAEEVSDQFWKVVKSTPIYP